MTEQHDKNKPEQEKSWIESLADRSTGLPREESKKPAEKDTGSKQLWRFAGLGIQFAVTVALFAWIGNQIDRWRGWNNAGLLTAVLIAVIGNLYLLIKEALKANR